MKKKKKKQNPIDEKIKELKNILDPRYFHVCVTMKGIDNIEWSVFYKNLHIEKYFSRKNREILTSQKNTINDIYKLKKKFEEEKHKEFLNNMKEYINISYTAFNVMSKAKVKIINTATNTISLILGANVANIIFLNNIHFSFLSMILSILIAILSIVRANKLEKEIQLAQQKIKEDYIAEKIKRQGLYFVKRLKDEV